MVIVIKSDAFWGKVTHVFKEQPEAIHPLTAKTPQSRLTLLQRASQKYLAAYKLYRANLPSEEVEEQRVVNVMELYRPHCRCKLAQCMGEGGCDTRWASGGGESSSYARCVPARTCPRAGVMRASA